MADHSLICTEDRNGVRILRLAHGKVSALDIELAEAFLAELDAAVAADVRALIITGTGTAFSAGVDLFRIVKDGPEYGRRFLPVLDAMLLATLTFPVPVVAAVNGHAIAGGCILAACCDRRIMAEGRARIGVPELAVGVPFPSMPLQILAARLSDSALRDLVYSGRTVLPDEAATLGLVDEICPAEGLVERATASALQLAAIPAGAFLLTKQAFYAPILDRVSAQTDLNARVVKAWTEPHTYDTIRAYLARTVGKK